MLLLRLLLEESDKWTLFDVDISLDVVVVFATLVGFALAWAIGANDVANTFGTSVGAKVLTVRQAVVIAAIFEFLGAFLMGSQVATTIQSIIDPLDYEDNPEQLAVGLTAAMIGAWSLVTVATWFSLPVSATHAVIGAVMGFAIVAQGIDGVIWEEVGRIAFSWVASPVLSGLLALVMYLLVRTLVLRSSNSFYRGLAFMPLCYFFTLTINVFLVIFKASGGGLIDFSSLETWALVLIALGSGFVAGLLSLASLPWVKRKAEERSALKLEQQALNGPEPEGGEEEDVACVPVSVPSPAPYHSSEAEEDGFSKALYDEEEEERQEAKEESEEKVIDLRENVEKFEPKTEELFSSLQVLTACFGSFAHGANDVANAIGPYAMIVSVNQTGVVTADAAIQWWILAGGGLGIVIGLATWGYKVMMTIGENLAKVTPSRGFNIELASAITVVTGSKLGLPLSTTHCKVGAVVGVGLADGKNAVNWKLVLTVFGGWVITLPIAGAVAGVFYLAMWYLVDYTIT